MVEAKRRRTTSPDVDSDELMRARKGKEPIQRYSIREERSESKTHRWHLLSLPVPHSKCPPQISLGHLLQFRVPPHMLPHALPSADLSPLSLPRPIDSAILSSLAQVVEKVDVEDVIVWRERWDGSFAGGEVGRDTFREIVVHEGVRAGLKEVDEAGEGGGVFPAGGLEGRRDRGMRRV
jgi:hypothetical protein